MATYNFCTLFDSYYFSRGLALYNSLLTNCDNFHLYIFAFDDIVYERLTGLNLCNATIISLLEFEDKELLEVKGQRSKAEYCWTATPSTILYAINSFRLDSCTYIDADLYFYSDPKELFYEIGDASIALTLHNYSRMYDQSSTSGKYCVQFVYFKNDFNGILALNWWRNACLDWCYARLENGKFGDQKYLDDWTERFDNVHVVKNHGAGLALWNAERYIIEKEDNQFIIKEHSSNNIYNLIFYHFHGLKFNADIDKVIVRPTKFSFGKKLRQLIYIDYINVLIKIDNPGVKNIKIVFQDISPLMKLYLPLHFVIKKSELLQKVKAFIIPSMK